MRPIDFVVFDGDSSPNVPAYKVAEAMMLPITVRGAGGDFVILSYYNARAKPGAVGDSA